MLIFDNAQIGNKLLLYRKKIGYTQGEVADLAGISDRTYADIERGSVNARVDTILNICKVLKITPNDIFVEEDTSLDIKQEELFNELNELSVNEKTTALKLLSIYVKSLK